MLKLKYILLLLTVLAVWPVRAQRGVEPWRDSLVTAPLRDTIVLPRWEPHMAVSTGFVGSSRGDNRLYTSVAPSVTYRPSDRWRVSGGFRLTSDMGLDPRYAAQPAVSRAPRRRNGGTGLVSAYAEAEYQASDRLWLGATLYHLSGQYAPFYGPARGEAFDVSVTALTAQAAYRFSRGSVLHLSMTVLRDNTGMAPYLLYDTWMHQGWGGWGRFASPTDCYRMAASPVYYGMMY